MIRKFHFWVFFLQKTKTLIEQDTLTPYVHCNIIYNSHDMEQPEHPLMDECIKMIIVCVYTNIYECNGILLHMKSLHVP